MANIPNIQPYWSSCRLQCFSSCSRFCCSFQVDLQVDADGDNDAHADIRLQIGRFNNFLDHCGIQLAGSRFAPVVGVPRVQGVLRVAVFVVGAVGAVGIVGVFDVGGVGVGFSFGLGVVVWYTGPHSIGQRLNNPRLRVTVIVMMMMLAIKDDDL